MGSPKNHAEDLADRLRLYLPLAAHAKPVLLATLRSQFACPRVGPRLRVTNVFHAEEAGGLMCYFSLLDPLMTGKLFVAPIAQIALDKTLSIVREVAAYQICDAALSGPN